MVDRDYAVEDGAEMDAEERATLDKVPLTRVKKDIIHFHGSP